MVNIHECASIGLFRSYFSMDGELPYRKSEPVAHDDSFPAPPPRPVTVDEELTFRETGPAAHGDPLPGIPPVVVIASDPPLAPPPVTDGELSYRDIERVDHGESFPEQLPLAVVAVDPPRGPAQEPPPFVAISDGLPPEPPPIFAAPVPGPLPRLLAGLESGILGAAVMIAWFAMDSLLENQYWWAMLNLWGAGVYHNRVFSMGFGAATLAGASTHFFLHGLGGALWSLLAARISNYWLHLFFSFAAAAAWYWLLMHTFWPAVAPVVSRITPLPATILAYFLFGAALSRSAQRARQLSTVWET